MAMDRRKIMSGSTPASTALLQSELDVPLLHLRRSLGKSDAARAWLRAADAVRSLQNRIQDLKISCDLIPRQTIYLPGNILDNDALKEEARAREKVGLRARYIGRPALAQFAGLHKAGAVITSGNAEVDPVKLVAGLWKKFVEHGGYLQDGTEVVEVDQSLFRVRLTLKEGRPLYAKHVIFCTGYEIPEELKPRGYKIHSTWVLATKKQPGKIWKSKSLIWESADPYLYLRSTADGRIIAGGEDEEFEDEEKRNKLTPAKIKTIARKAKALIPEADFTPEFSWTGCFGESPHGLPAIQRIPGLSRCYTVLCFGGNGITFSMLAAQILGLELQGISDHDASLFGLRH